MRGGQREAMANLTDAVADDLARRFDEGVPYQVIHSVAEECLGLWPDARINDYIPILATKCARDRLAEQGFAPRTSHGRGVDFVHLTPAAR